MSLITMRSEAYLGEAGQGAALSRLSEESPAQWLLGNTYYNVTKTKMKTYRNLSTVAHVCNLSTRGFWNRRTAMSLRPLRTTFWVPGHGLYIKNTSKINKVVFGNRRKMPRGDVWEDEGGWGQKKGRSLGCLFYSVPIGWAFTVCCPSCRIRV